MNSKCFEQKKHFQDSKPKLMIEELINAMASDISRPVIMNRNEKNFNKYIKIAKKTAVEKTTKQPNKCFFLSEPTKVVV